MSEKNQNTVQSALTELNQRPCLGCFLIGVVFVIILLLSSGNSPTSPTPITQPKDPSPAFMLASIHIGHNSPGATTVDSFETLLNALRIQCPNESKKQIAEYLFISYENIREMTPVTLLEVGEAINGSFPDEITYTFSCAEVAAAFTTLIIENN